MRRLPDFLVIGAQKSGTSWLHRELRAHPGVYMPATKELHFFDKRVRRRSVRWYARHFRDAPAPAVCGEATPSYLFYRWVPRRIHRVMPTVKLAAILRDPAERAYSQWRMLVSKGMLDPGMPFLEAFDRGLPALDSIRERGCYHDQLQRYLRLFGKDQVLVLLYDDLVADPAGLLKSAFSYLGVDERFSSGTQMERHPTSYEDFDGVPRHMSADERAAATARYRDSIERLEALLGRDLRAWKA